MVLHACNSSYCGGWGRKIIWTWEAEVAVSRDHATALSLGKRVRLRLNNNKKSMDESQVDLNSSLNCISLLKNLQFPNNTYHVGSFQGLQEITYVKCWVHYLAYSYSVRLAIIIKTGWNLDSTKNIKISQAWWRAPIVPATQEAEAGEWHEPGRQSLQWAEITPLHFSLGNTVRLCLKKTI